jgi:23S rRNA (uridine2552-2'-O)-methyltransferase
MLFYSQTQEDMQKAGSGTRSLRVRVKTAKKRSNSSARWLERQLNDPYVQRAKREGYRSRAAYKLMEIDDRFHILKPGAVVVDLGAAPGGWAQVAADRVKAGVHGVANVVGIDLLPMTGLPHVTMLVMDFMDARAPSSLREMIGGRADVVLSDMAPNTTGHGGTDHLRIVALAEAAFEFACAILKDNGSFVTKVWQGGAERELLALAKKRFAAVKHVKPKASRAESAETYLVATGFKR